MQESALCPPHPPPLPALHPHAGLPLARRGVWRRRQERRRWGLIRGRKGREMAGRGGGKDSFRKRESKNKQGARREKRRKGWGRRRRRPKGPPALFSFPSLAFLREALEGQFAALPALADPGREEASCTPFSLSRPLVQGVRSLGR